MEHYTTNILLRYFNRFLCYNILSCTIVLATDTKHITLTYGLRSLSEKSAFKNIPGCAILISETYTHTCVHVIAIYAE